MRQVSIGRALPRRRDARSEEMWGASIWDLSSEVGLRAAMIPLRLLGLQARPLDYHTN